MIDELILAFELYNIVFCAYPVIPGASPENQDNYKPQQLKAFVCFFKNHHIDYDTLQQKHAQLTQPNCCVPAGRLGATFKTW